MEEWIDLKQQLKLISVDTKKLRTREKDLSTYIKAVMKTNEIDKIKNEQKHVSVSHNVAERKGTVTAKGIKELISSFYESRGDPNTRDQLFKYIEDNRTVKISETLTLKNDA